MDVSKSHQIQTQDVNGEHLFKCDLTLETLALLSVHYFSDVLLCLTVDHCSISFGMLFSPILIVDIILA